jgi:hypothetical protein
LITPVLFSFSGADIEIKKPPLHGAGV